VGKGFANLTLILASDDEESKCSAGSTVRGYLFLVLSEVLGGEQRESVGEGDRCDRGRSR
jgi:hypothetical protein